MIGTYGPEQAAIARKVVGSDTEYAARLLDAVAEYGLLLADNWRNCPTVLTNPRHRHTSQQCWDSAARRMVGALDHRIWFRDGSRRWAVLDQHYGPRARFLPIPGTTGVVLPDSPYGHGTHAVLYLGTPATDRQEASA